jgi:hypothetical protein
MSDTKEFSRDEWMERARNEKPRDLYADAVGNDWASYLDKIPERMHGGLVRWILFAIPPGHFLGRVLANDLMGALGRADDENRNLLWAYCNFLHNGCPGGRVCFGSEAVLKTWKGLIK